MLSHWLWMHSRIVRTWCVGELVRCWRTRWIEQHCRTWRPCSATATTEPSRMFDALFVPSRARTITRSRILTTRERSAGWSTRATPTTVGTAAPWTGSREGGCHSDCVDDYAATHRKTVNSCRVVVGGTDPWAQRPASRFSRGAAGLDRYAQAVRTFVARVAVAFNVRLFVGLPGLQGPWFHVWLLGNP